MVMKEPMSCFIETIFLLQRLTERMASWDKELIKFPPHESGRRVITWFHSLFHID